MVTMDAHIVKTEASINATDICIYQQNHILIANKPSDIDAWARKAEEILKPVFGIKGFSMLMKHITIHHVPIDYLHAILQGITKQFL